MNSLLPIACPFKINNEEINDVISEFNILFFKSRNRLEDLIDFIQTYDTKRINIEFPEGVHIPILLSITKISGMIYVRLKASDIMSVQELKKNNIRFFFDASLPVYNYTNLESFINLGVSDVYISDDLCYDMEEVSKICAAKNVSIRLILNHIPATSLDKSTNPKSPIYGPQDMDVILKYYDMFEFDCGEHYDWAMFDVLYRAWFVRKYWHGQLNEINSDVLLDYHNDTIYPNFAEYKMTCGRRCSKRASNPCNKCEQTVALGKEFAGKHVRFNSGQK